MEIMDIVAHLQRLVGFCLFVDKLAVSSLDNNRAILNLELGGRVYVVTLDKGTEDVVSFNVDTDLGEGQDIYLADKPPFVDPIIQDDGKWHLVTTINCSDGLAQRLEKMLSHTALCHDAAKLKAAVKSCTGTVLVHGEVTLARDNHQITVHIYRDFRLALESDLADK